MGTNCRILEQPRIKIIDGAAINCGDGVVLNSDPLNYHAGMPFPVTLIADRAGAFISIGSRSRLHGCCLHAWLSVRIGEGCLIAAGAQVLDAHGHATEPELSRLRAQVPDVPEEVTIGDHCWLCIGALVLKGVHLGEGSTVAPYSVVRKGNYPPFSILAGSPARVVRTVPPETVLAAETLAERFTTNERPLNAW